MVSQLAQEGINEQSFEKISVSDICERCGMNRKSFYYHFKDKYDLVNWIFDTEFVELNQNHALETRLLSHSIPDRRFPGRPIHPRAPERISLRCFFHSFPKKQKEIPPVPICEARWDPVWVKPTG